MGVRYSHSGNLYPSVGRLQPVTASIDDERHKVLKLIGIRDDRSLEDLIREGIDHVIAKHSHVKRLETVGV